MMEPTRAELQALQEAHLSFLENQYNKILVKEVPILRCINYKTIQVLNNVGLKALLKPEGDEE